MFFYSLVQVVVVDSEENFFCTSNMRLKKTEWSTLGCPALITWPLFPSQGIFVCLSLSLVFLFEIPFPYTSLSVHIFSFSLSLSHFLWHSLSNTWHWRPLSQFFFHCLCSSFFSFICLIVFLFLFFFEVDATNNT